MREEPLISPEERAIVERACAQLSEHFSSVRIFVTRHDGEKDASGAFSYGKGNYYAQEGQIKEWVEMKIEQSRQWQIARDKEDDES